MFLYFQRLEFGPAALVLHKHKANKQNSLKSHFSGRLVTSFLVSATSVLPVCTLHSPLALQSQKLALSQKTQLVWINNDFEPLCWKCYWAKNNPGYSVEAKPLLVSLPRGTAVWVLCRSSVRSPAPPHWMDRTKHRPNNIWRWFWAVARITLVFLFFKSFTHFSVLSWRCNGHTDGQIEIQ